MEEKLKRRIATKGLSDRAAAPLTIESRQGCLWIVLPDGINMDSHPQLEEKIDESLASKAGDKLVVDLSKTKNMYSAGFGMIVRLKKAAEARGCATFVVNASSRVMEAMAYLGLQKIIRVYEEGDKLDFLPDARETGATDPNEP